MKTSMLASGGNFRAAVAPMLNRSRRHFLLSGGTAALGAACMPGGIRTARAAASADGVGATRFGGFQVGIQSNALASLSPDVAILLGHVVDLGVGQVEFIGGRHYPVTADADVIGRMQSLLAHHKLAMPSYFHGELPADEAVLEALFAFCRANRTRVIVGMPVPEAFPMLDRLVRRDNIRVAIHNYGPGARYERVEQMIQAVAPWDWRIGYCLDTGHTMRSGEQPVEAIRRLAGRLYGLHLREHAAVQRDPQPPETIVGEGAMDLTALCRALRETHFDGPLIFEIYHNPAAPLDAIRRSLDNFATAASAKT